MEEQTNKVVNLFENYFENTVFEVGDVFTSLEGRDGWVPINSLLRFDETLGDKVTSLLADSLKSAKTINFAVSDDGLNVRRDVKPLAVPTTYLEPDDLRTVYMRGFALTSNENDILTWANRLGTVEKMKRLMLQNSELAPEFFGSILFRYNTRADAEVAVLSTDLYRGQRIVRKFEKDFCDDDKKAEAKRKIFALEQLQRKRAKEKRLRRIAKRQAIKQKLAAAKGVDGTVASKNDRRRERKRNKKAISGDIPAEKKIKIEPN